MFPIEWHSEQEEDACLLKIYPRVVYDKTVRLVCRRRCRHLLAKALEVQVSFALPAMVFVLLQNSTLPEPLHLRRGQPLTD